jgi:hypothetical protein
MGELTVSYERKFSDGNYGSEGLSLSMTWETISEGDAASGELDMATEVLRGQVLHQLARSAAERVRWAANHELHARDPKPAVERDEVAIALDGEETSVEDLPF